MRKPRARALNAPVAQPARRRPRNLLFIMKRYLLLLMLCVIATADAVAQVLTQQDVTKLLELKIPEQTIIEKVKSSGTSFTQGTAHSDRLKKAGARDALIAAMQAT